MSGRQARGLELDQLVKDEDMGVRMGVAWRGRDKDLDILRFDSEWGVRCAVAKAGRDKDLQLLARDPNRFVREAKAWAKKQDALARERRWLKTSNSQYEKDLVDLTKLQEMGRIKASLDLEEVARQLPAWRLEELEKQGSK